jgi:hypothetical protein
MNKEIANQLSWLTRNKIRLRYSIVGVKTRKWWDNFQSKYIHNDKEELEKLLSDMIKDSLNEQ